MKTVSRDAIRPIFNNAVQECAMSTSLPHEFLKWGGLAARYEKIFADTKAALFSEMNGRLRLPPGTPWHSLDLVDKKVRFMSASGGFDYRITIDTDCFIARDITAYNLVEEVIGIGPYYTERMASCPATVSIEDAKTPDDALLSMFPRYGGEASTWVDIDHDNELEDLSPNDLIPLNHDGVDFFTKINNPYLKIVHYRDVSGLPIHEIVMRSRGRTLAIIGVALDFEIKNCNTVMPEEIDTLIAALKLASEIKQAVDEWWSMTSWNPAVWDKINSQ